jgi:hypothetical protein
MRNLESMIAQFVDDLLQTIREATVDDLRELLISSGEREPAGAPLRTATLFEHDIRAVPNRVGGMVRIDREPHRASSDPSCSLPPVAEITDPESLLSLGAARPASEVGLRETAHRGWLEPPPLERLSSTRTPQMELPIAPAERAAAADSTLELELESPASSIRPSVRLSDNETLARISNAGIVIRRRKKA